MKTFILGVGLSGLITMAARGGEPAATTNSPASATTNAARASSVDTEIRTYALPEVGTLRLTVPKAWHDSFSKTIELVTRVDNLMFWGEDTNVFALRVGAIHMDAQKVKTFSLRPTLEDEARQELPAKAKGPEISDFTGVETTGSFFSLTDDTVNANKPKPGEFKYLTLGYARLSPLVLSFRMLSNRAGDAERDMVLQMIKSARLEPASN